VCLNSQSAVKPNLVLLPIDVSAEDADLETEYGAALQEGLQDRYTVFYGAAVEKELEKEYSKIDCDAETCNQNVVIAFNGELIADGAVKRIKGGYLLKLVVRNVLTSQVVETKTYPCRGCDSFSVMGRLKTLGRGLNNGSTKGSSSNESNAIKADIGGKAILILDSVPSGASITINDKHAGKTPYQGLNHQIGDNLLIELKHSVYKTHVMEIGLEQAITQLQPTKLDIGQGQVLITVQPFTADTLIYVDGQAKGTAPLQLTLAAGSHQIKANHKGRDSESRTLNLFNGDSKTLSLPLSSNINDLGMNFVQIPAGRFQMGSNETDNERPIHTVNVSAFKMMTTEVTQGQWQAIMGENPSYFDGWIFSNDDHPVERVSWNDAQNFIIKLNQKTGKVYRLPSEAEWEYAARAGSTTKYSWGDDIDCSKARYGHYVNKCGKQKSTDPVKSFKPNAFGLFDMHGNVLEWTQDCWNISYKGAPSDGGPWLKGDCSYKIIRGGSWNSDPYSLRSAARNRMIHKAIDKYFGFRLVQGP
tara:strand:+ start:407 stop:1996 length:1590 start_codon:yes stop_codon:yes gene_type:complete